MRHNKTGRKLGRNSSHRKAMLRNLATSLIVEEKVVTTDARAKEVRKVVDRLITWGKRGDLHARRMAAEVLTTSDSVKKLFEQIGPRFQARQGGYTRILKMGVRQGDCASVARIELVEGQVAAAAAE